MTHDQSSPAYLDSIITDITGELAKLHDMEQPSSDTIAQATRFMETRIEEIEQWWQQWEQEFVEAFK